MPIQSQIEDFGTFRARTAGALTALAEVYCGAFHYPSSRVDEVADMILSEIRAGHVYLIWLVEDRICGFVSYRFDVHHGDVLVELCHIGCLSRPGAIGGGRKLITAMEQDITSRLALWAGDIMYCVYLRTHMTNKLAQNLYRRCGFLPVAMLPSHYHGGVDELVWQKLYDAPDEEKERLELYSRHFEAQLANFYSQLPSFEPAFVRTA